MFEIPKLKNKHLQQVAWAVFSPSLLNHELAVNYIRDGEHYNQVLSVLHQLDSNEQEVEKHFRSVPKKPLGKYFEALILFILQHDERYEVVLNNHQIIVDKRTIGEIDLIVRDTVTGELEHWEVALKFYLQSEPSEEYQFMIGPNVADNLEKKIEKLIKHQLPLSTDLTQFGISKTQTIKNKLLLKGQFFYHLSHNNRCNIIPNDANPDHENGWWSFAREIEKAIDENLLWSVVAKPEWIGKTTRNNSLNLLNNKDFNKSIKVHFKDNPQGLMSIGFKEKNGSYIEQSRGFIVRNDWPKPQKKE